MPAASPIANDGGIARVAPRASCVAEMQRPAQTFTRSGPGRLHSGLTAAVVLGWLLAVFLLDSVRFVVFNPPGKTGFEVFIALGQLLGALVVILAASEAERPRMKWISSGLLVLGQGALGFGFVLPLFKSITDPTISICKSLLIRSAALTRLAIGLVPETRPSLIRRIAVTIFAIGTVAALIFIVRGHSLPELVRMPDMVTLHGVATSTTFPDLTPSHLD